MKFTPREQQKTTTWSGGMTTELSIYPSSAEFKSGNYSFRLSTATVEIETSTFTALPNVNRTLMVLEGAMKLVHENKHEAELNPFEVDNFSGDWNTTSVGKCVDFNLMCKGKTKGELSSLNIENEACAEITLNGEMNFIYLYTGNLKVDDVIVEEGSLIELESSTIELEAIGDCDLVLVEIVNVQV